MKFEDFLHAHARPVEFSSGQHVFMQGDADRSLYLLREGLLKAYYLSENGKEAVKSFLLPGDVIGSLAAFGQHGICSFNLLCMEPTKLLGVRFDKLIETSRQDQELANAMVDMLLQLSMKKEKREFDFLCRSAEERYRELLELSPNLVEKVTQNDVARYLGVTPVALSRLKKRITATLA